MKRVTICALCWLILLTVGCDKNEPFITQTAAHSIRAGEVEFTLLVTDLEGKPQTVFKAGENFLMTFRVKNRSNQEVKVCEGSLFDNDKIGVQLFTVYKQTNEAGNSKSIAVGRPYEAIVTACRVYAPSIIKAQSEQTITLPWLWGSRNQNQQDFYNVPDFGFYLGNGGGCTTSAYYSGQAPRTSGLTAGKYFTQLSATIDKGKISLRYDFTVE